MIEAARLLALREGLTLLEALRVLGAL